MRRVLATAFILTTAATPGSACSPTRYPTSRSPRDLFFLGTALRDTVVTGNGTVSSRYGQRFAVDRMGKPWQAQLPKGAKSVILVPWSLDAGCKPVPWTTRGTWVTPTTSGIFRGVLRPRSEWIKGEPTIDVRLGVFYNGAVPMPAYAPATPDTLTPAQFLELMEALPFGDSLRFDPVRAVAALNDWVAFHPKEAAAVPAPEILRMARYFTDEARKGRNILPVAGTYRVEVSLPWGERRTYFTRTGTSPFGGNTHSRHRADSTAASDGPAFATLQAINALTERSLPDGVTQASTSFHHVSVEPLFQFGDSTEWRGSLWGLDALHDLEPDSTRRARLMELVDRSQKERSDNWFWNPGIWTRTTGLPLQFKWVARNEKEVFYTVTAVQISDRVLR